MTRVELTDRQRTVLVAVAAALLVVTSSVGVFIAGAASTAAAQSGEDCDTTVRHTKYSDNETAISKLANGTTVSSINRNTKTSVGQSDTFYRVTGDNPNGYCVHFVLEVDKEAIPPADMPGTVYSNEGDYTASWDAIHSFTTNETYTRIEFTLPPGTTATFAPNQARVFSVSWYSENVEKSKSAWQRALDKVTPGNPALSQKEYTIDPNETGARITIPMENESTGQTIESYKAIYRPKPSAGWRKVGTDATDPVYKSEASDGSAVTIVFRKKSAEVKFIANPGILERMDYEAKGYSSGIDILSDWEFSLPFAVTVPGGAA